MYVKFALQYPRSFSNSHSSESQSNYADQRDQYTMELKNDQDQRIPSAHFSNDQAQPGCLARRYISCVKYKRIAQRGRVAHPNEILSMQNFEENGESGAQLDL